jgi:hypothetical protein
MLSMKRVAILALGGILVHLSWGAALAAPGNGEAPAKKARPATASAVEGSKLKLLTLTEKAAARLDIQTGQVADSAGRMVTPYSSVMYDIGGGTWVYTVPKPLTYLRHSVVVDTISGDKAYLREGPPLGTSVVTVGVAELFGTEKGLGH